MLRWAWRAGGFTKLGRQIWGKKRRKGKKRKEKQKERLRVREEKKSKRKEKKRKRKRKEETPPRGAPLLRSDPPGGAPQGGPPGEKLFWKVT